MKQYTSQEQTAKLIELGFEKPKGWYVDGVTNNIKLYVNIDENPMMFNYSIGELIEMLPSIIRLLYCRKIIGVSVEYSFDNLSGNTPPLYLFYQNRNLIDNLFDAVVKLKEDRVI